MRYPLDRLYEEVAFVAYHFHWAHDDVLDLPHWERRRWCAEISRINERMNAAAPSGSGGGRGLPSGVDLSPVGSSGSRAQSGRTLDLGEF